MTFPLFHLSPLSTSLVFIFLCPFLLQATFHYLKVWNRLHKHLFDSNGLVHHCLLSYFLPSYLPTHPLIYLTTHPPTYLPTCLFTYLPTILSTYPPIHPTTHSTTHPPTHLSAYIVTFLPTYLRTSHLPTYLTVIYIPTNPPAYQILS